MGDNGSPFSNQGNGGMNGNQNGGGGGARAGSGGGLGPPPYSGSNFPSFPTSSGSGFTRPTSFPFQTTASSASQTSSSSSLGISDNGTATTTKAGLSGGVIAAIVILVLLLLSAPVALLIYRRTQPKRQHRKSIGAPPPKSHLPLYEYFSQRSIFSEANSNRNSLQSTLLDTKPLPPDPEEHPTFRVSAPPPPRAHLRSSLAMTERSMSVYSDTNLYFITSQEIGMETRLPSRGGEALLRQGLVLEEDNPFRGSRMPTRLSRISGELEYRGARADWKKEGVEDPFETPLGSPKFMIGEGKWRRPYKGKLRPGMGVQRAMTPASQMDI